ncbi:hypothetical protein [Aureimonas leprariae]|nr:hypothetical protein [Aureimonas leprariae]
MSTDTRETGHGKTQPGIQAEACCIAAGAVEASSKHQNPDSVLST